MVIRAMSKEVVERTIAVWKEIKARESVTEEEKGEICRAHGVALKNYYRDLGDLKENVNFLGPIIDTVTKMGLIAKASKQEIGKKIVQTKIAKAKKGFYFGPPHFGYKIVDGKPAPTEDLKTVSEAMRRFLRGEPQYKIADGLHISRRRLYCIFRDKFYRGEYVFMGKPFHGNWELPVTPEKYDEVQKRLGAKSGRLLPGYEWKDRKRILKKGWKEKYEKAFKLHMKKYSVAQISKKMKLPLGMVKAMLTNRKVTGKDEVDGKIVDSGYEQAVDPDTWQRAHTVKIPGYKKKQDEAKVVEDKILASMPCYRWQLREKVKLKSTSIDKVIRRLMSGQRPRIKERPEDGLLQKKWIPYPQGPLVATREKRESLKRRRILDVLSKEEGLRLSEIAKKTNIVFSTLSMNIHKLFHEGLVKEEDCKIRISELGIAVLKRAVSQEEPQKTIK